MNKDKINQYRNNYLNSRSQPGIMAQLFQTLAQLLSQSHQNLQDKDFDSYLVNTQKLIRVIHQATITLTNPVALDPSQTPEEVQCLYLYFQGLSKSLHKYLNQRDMDEYHKLLNHLHEMRDQFLSSSSPKLEHNQGVDSPPTQIPWEI